MRLLQLSAPHWLEKTPAGTGGELYLSRMATRHASWRRQLELTKQNSRDERHSWRMVAALRTHVTYGTGKIEDRQISRCDTVQIQPK